MNAAVLSAMLILPSFVTGQQRVPGGVSAIRAGAWQHIGNAYVDARADHDRIRVRGRPFSALALGVNGGTVHFHQMVIHFRDGGSQVLPVGTVVRSGGRTDPLPIRGGQRQISQVELLVQKRNIQPWQAQGGSVWKALSRPY